jgi:hypothetical protein
MDMVDLDEVGEIEAMGIITSLAARNGWAIGIVTGDDIDEYREAMGQPPIPQERWEAVRSSDDWRSLATTMRELGLARARTLF